MYFFWVRYPKSLDEGPEGFPSLWYGYDCRIVRYYEGLLSHARATYALPPHEMSTILLALSSSPGSPPLDDSPQAVAFPSSNRATHTFSPHEMSVTFFRISISYPSHSSASFKPLTFGGINEIDTLVPIVGSILVIIPINDWLDL